MEARTPCDRCGTFIEVLQLRDDGVRLCAECWPQHSPLPLRFTPRTLWGLLWRPRATLNRMRRTGAGIVDVPWVLLVGALGDLTAFMIGIVSRATTESLTERVGRPTLLPALMQITADLWAWSALWPWITVLASLTLVPTLDSLLLRALGEKVSFREALRLSALTLVPLSLAHPVMWAVVGCWVGAARTLPIPDAQIGTPLSAQVLSSLGLALTVLAVLGLPVWVVVLRARVFRLLLGGSSKRAVMVALSFPLVCIALAALRST